MRLRAPITFQDGTTQATAAAAGGSSLLEIDAGGNIGATYTVPTAGNKTVAVRNIVLNANAAITLTGLLTSGTSRYQSITLVGKQDVTGGRTLSLNDGSGAASVTIPTAANAGFVVNISWDGTDAFVVVPNTYEAGVASKELPRFGKLIVAGHSGAEPYGVYSTFGWPKKLAKAVGADLTNFAISGSRIAQADISVQRGGYAYNLNSILPTDPNMVSNARVVRRTAPYVPPADLFCIQTISNDLGQSGLTPASAAARAGDSLEAIIAARCRAGAVFLADDANIAYSGTSWTAATGLPQLLTGGKGRYTATVGAYFDVTTQTDFFGELVFLFLVGGAYGGQVSFTDVTGGGSIALGTLDCNTYAGTVDAGSGATQTTPRVTYKRITPTLGGARTIRATVTGITGSNDGTAPTVVGFDSVSMTAVDALPLVVVINHPDAPGLATANNDLINAACVSACNKFADGRVVLGDLRGTFNTVTAGGVPMSQIASAQPRTGFNNPDGHASELGHPIELQMILDTIRNAPTLGSRSQITGNGHQTYRSFQPAGTITAEATFASTWSASSMTLSGGNANGLQYALDSSNNVTLRGSLKKSAASSTFEQITDQPLHSSCRPSESVFLQGMSLTSGNVVGACTILVGANGHLYHVSGIAAANTSIFVNESFSADGGLPL